YNTPIPGIPLIIQQWSAVDETGDPDDDPDGPGDPDEDPDDPDPPSPIVYERFTSIDDIFYDAYGNQVPQDGAWQLIESAGDPLVDKIINLGVWERIEDTDELGNSLSRAVDLLQGDTDLENALRQIYMGVSETLPDVVDGNLP